VTRFSRVTKLGLGLLSGFILTNPFCFGSPVSAQTDVSDWNPVLAPKSSDIRPSVHLPAAPPSAADFSQSEIQELQKRYGIHAAQNPVNQAMTLATDSLGWRDQQALMIISHQAFAIQASAKQYQLNPAVLAAILFDEIRHKKPTEELMTQLGFAQTLGLAQISLRELVMQGFYDSELAELISSGVFTEDLQALQSAGKLSLQKDLRKLRVQELRIYLMPPQILARLPQELIEKGQKLLLDPVENIGVLARQIARVRKQQGISAHEGFFSLEKFSTKHALAQTVIFHNGRLDYAHKILNYLRLPQLEIALSGCYHMSTYSIEKVQIEAAPAQKPILKNNYLLWMPR
jgi:hypothetical protein